MTDLSATILAFLTRHMGSPKISGRGKQYAFICPNCHHGYNLEINLDDVRHPKLHCWYCELKPHTLFTLAKKWLPQGALAELIGILDIISLEPAERAKQEIRAVELPVDYQFVLPATTLAKSNALLYLHKRKISDATIKAMHLGVSQEHPNRVIVPSIDGDGNLNFYTARSVDGSKPSYINPPCSRNIIFNEIDVDLSQPLLITEGPFDLMSARRVVDNVTCLLGSTLDVRSKLYQAIATHMTPVTLSLDNDARRKTANIASSLLLAGIDICITPPTISEDLGAATVEEIGQLLANKKRIEDSMQLVSMRLEEYD